MWLSSNMVEKSSVSSKEENELHQMTAVASCEISIRTFILQMESVV